MYPLANAFCRLVCSGPFATSNCLARCQWMDSQNYKANDFCILWSVLFSVPGWFERDTTQAWFTAWCRLLAQETYPELAKSISSMIAEDGTVRENATDAVKTTRQRVETLESRVKGILGGQDGEITLQGGRWCVAVPQSTWLSHMRVCGYLHSDVYAICITQLSWCVAVPQSTWLSHLRVCGYIHSDILLCLCHLYYIALVVCGSTAEYLIIPRDDVWVCT